MQVGFLIKIPNSKGRDPSFTTYLGEEFGRYAAAPGESWDVLPDDVVFATRAIAASVLKEALETVRYTAPEYLPGGAKMAERVAAAEIVEIKAPEYYVHVRYDGLHRSWRRRFNGEEKEKS